MADNPFPLGKIAIGDVFGGIGDFIGGVRDAFGGDIPFVGRSGGGTPSSAIVSNADQPFDLTDWLGLTDPAPTNGAVGSNIAGCAIELPVQMKQIHRAPRGYVVVTKPDGSKVAMLRQVAIACKLWRAPRKPPISVSDWRCLGKAAAVVKKMDVVAKRSNAVTGKAPLRRVRRTSGR